MPFRFVVEPPISKFSLIEVTLRPNLPSARQRMVKPAAPTIGLHQTDVIFISEPVDAIQQFLAISEIADHDQDLSASRARGKTAILVIAQVSPSTKLCILPSAIAVRMSDTVKRPPIRSSRRANFCVIGVRSHTPQFPHSQTIAYSNPACWLIETHRED